MSVSRIEPDLIASTRTPHDPGGPRLSTPERKRLTSELLEEIAETKDDLRRQRLRRLVVELNLEVAESVARRFRGRGLAEEDLLQVAYEGLLKAVLRHNCTFHNDFLSFAVPTIRGEVRRHFRDQGWTVRPPRPIQELQARLPRAREELTQELGRDPRPGELARALGVDPNEVLAAQAANGCFHPTSLEFRPHGDAGPSLADRIVQVDESHDVVDARVTLAPAVRELSERQQRILYLRFYEGLTQREIGDEFGVTQMQISRDLARILRRLRESIDRKRPARAGLTDSRAAARPPHGPSR